MKWLDPQPVSASPEISAAYSGSILLAEQLAQRGIDALPQAQAYLDPRAHKPASPFDFPDMPAAVQRVQAAIQNKQTIGIWGDFDVDGQTSTALLVDGLRRAGAQVRYHVPNRARESHGIRLPFLQEFMREGLNLLITCDTGISELESLTYAASQGLDVILTDHHTPPETLPPALALLNPRLLPDDHPMQDMAGVGTAYQLIRALYETQSRAGDADVFLDLVALGTVADLADLSRENRYYVQRGLELMRSDPRPALQALLTSADYRGSGINESLIGFTIGPRMNAAGRLDDANIVVEFLLSRDDAFLQAVAAQLEDLNSQRKLAVDGVYKSARDMLAQDPALGRYAALVLARPGWERGVVGIAASHLVEDFNKPVILLNLEGDTAAGSVRSVEGINIIRAIRENGSFLRTFGGHPMAAGLSLSADQLQPFRAALSKSVAAAAESLPAEKQLQIDAYLPLSNLTQSLVQEIDQLAPFGSGNPPPVLVSRNLEIADNPFLLGKDKHHKKIIVRNEQGESKEVLWWNARDQNMPQGKFDLAYYLRLNRFQGKESVVLEWIDAREAQTLATAPALPLFTSAFEDWRQPKDALNRLHALAGTEPLQCYAEGLNSQPPLTVKNRLQVEPTATLAILTPPPDFATLQRILKQAGAQRVIFMRLDQPDDSPDGFLRRLSGLLRYAISHYNGQTSLDQLAAALGQNRAAIELGLSWWQAHGDIFLQISDEGECTIEKNTAGAKTSTDELSQIAQRLDKLLSENAAFRSFYMRAEPDFLLRKG